MRDLLIGGATVVDGTGGPPFPADVEVRQGRITRVSRLPVPSPSPPVSPGGPAVRVIDAAGLHLAPGFIDIHNHSDLTLLADPGAQSMVGQGVTTVVVGNCGFSPAPWPGPEAGDRARWMREDAAFLTAGLADTVDWEWRSFAGYLGSLESQPLAVNVVALVGHGVIRGQVMGRAARPAGREELRQMRVLLEAALAEGAAGLSSGLIYYPSCYAGPEELAFLAEAVARAGKVYTTHIRGEGETLFEALAEAVRLARETGVSVEVSHLKAESRPLWGRMGEALALLDAARTEGLAVDCDQYPYAAYNTSLGSFLPPAIMEGDWRGLLASPAERTRVRRVMEEGQPGWTSSIKGMTWSDFVIGGSGDPAIDGRDLESIGSARGKEPGEVLFDLLLAHGPGLAVTGHAMHEDDVAAAAARPEVMVGSDGFALPYAGSGHPHPRSFGTFPRILGRYCRERQALPLELAVRKLTALPAAKLGLRDRGLVREGYAADLVLFDAKRVRDTASFREPRRRPEGIVHVLVNGTPVFPDRDEAVRAGKVLS